MKTNASYQKTKKQKKFQNGLIIYSSQVSFTRITKQIEKGRGALRSPSSNTQTKWHKREPMNQAAVHLHEFTLQ